MKYLFLILSLLGFIGLTDSTDGRGTSWSAKRAVPSQSTSGATSGILEGGVVASMDGTTSPPR